jgi:hypothetical protein
MRCDGETYLQGLRKLTPYRMKQKGQTWAQLHFRGRPAIYYVIVHQKLRLIESLLTSPEGRIWANQHYKECRFNPFATKWALKIVPWRRAIENRECVYKISEFPIHTAVRVACSFRRSFRRRRAEKIVQKLIELKADPNQGTYIFNEAPLHTALVADKFTLVKLLIQMDGRALSPVIALKKRHYSTLSKAHAAVIADNHQLVVHHTPLPLPLVSLIVNYLFSRD